MSIVEEITRAYAADQGVRPVTELDQVPGTYEAITPEWLSKILCKRHPGAAVTALRLDARDDGSSNRRRIFLEYNAAGQDAGLPATVFCKAAEGLENRLVLGVSGTALAEANFYNLVRDRLDIEATRAYFAGFDPRTFAYIIVMEDIAGRVEFCDETTRLDWDGAVSHVTTLAGLHGRFYESPELGSPALPFKRWPTWWADMMTGAPDFAASCGKAFVMAESVIPPRLFSRGAEVWPCTDASVARHNALPQTLIHSDVHFKNWYRTPDNRLGLSDWQLTTIGHWARDYAFATTTAQTVEQRRDWGPELLRVYLDALAAAGGARVGYDEAFLNVRQQLFTALAFWTITLRPAEGMPAMQPEHTTYEFIKRMATAIDDYDALDSF
jgi:hypothetical protein